MVICLPDVFIAILQYTGAHYSHAPITLLHLFLDVSISIKEMRDVCRDYRPLVY